MSTLEILQAQLNEAYAERARVQFELTQNQLEQVNPIKFRPNINKSRRTYMTFLHNKGGKIRKRIIEISQKINFLRRRIATYDDHSWKFEVDFYIHMKRVLKEMKERFHQE